MSACSVLKCNYIHGGFLKWWYPTTMGFPTKNDHFGVFWGYHHLRKDPHLHCTENQFRERGLIINFHRIFRGVVFERFPSNSSASRPAAFFQNPGAMEKGAKPISVFLWKSELPREALKQAPSGSGGEKKSL